MPVRFVCRPMIKDPFFLLRSQKCVNPREIEGFRFALIPLAATVGGEPAEFDQTGFVAVRTERERGHPVLEINQEAIRIPPVLETGDTVIGIANDRSARPCLAPRDLARRNQRNPDVSLRRHTRPPGASRL
jgi:hypothetical protein